jgi:hypothetical protein
MTTTDLIYRFLGLFKLSPRHLATFAITGLIIFLLPTEIVKKIIPVTLHNYYRPVAILVFVLSLSGLLVELAIIIYSKINIQLTIQKRKTRLDSLTEEEKDILRRYITNKTRTQHFGNFNGTVAEFKRLGILICYVQEYDVFKGIPYGIADWALEYLNSKPHLLKTSNGNNINKAKL